MASNSLFILENKSWGIKSNPKKIPKSYGPRQSQISGTLFDDGGTNLDGLCTKYKTEIIKDQPL